MIGLQQVVLNIFFTFLNKLCEFANMQINWEAISAISGLIGFLMAAITIKFTEESRRKQNIYENNTSAKPPHRSTFFFILTHAHIYIMCPLHKVNQKDTCENMPKACHYTLRRPLLWQKKYYALREKHSRFHVFALNQTVKNSELSGQMPQNPCVFQKQKSFGRKFASFTRASFII